MKKAINKNKILNPNIFQLIGQQNSNQILSLTSENEYIIDYENCVILYNSLNKTQSIISSSEKSSFIDYICLNPKMDVLVVVENIRDDCIFKFYQVSTNN